MDFNFTEEQSMIRDSLSRLIREQYDFDTRRKVIESESGWRPEMWAQFAELGLLMAPFSEEDGGLGGGQAHRVVCLGQVDFGARDPLPLSPRRVIVQPGSSGSHHSSFRPLFGWGLGEGGEEVQEVVILKGGKLFDVGMY